MHPFCPECIDLAKNGWWWLECMQKISSKKPSCTIKASNPAFQNRQICMQSTPQYLNMRDSLLTHFLPTFLTQNITLRKWRERKREREKVKAAGNPRTWTFPTSSSYLLSPHFRNEANGPDPNPSSVCVVCVRVKVNWWKLKKDTFAQLYLFNCSTIITLLHFIAI